MRKIESMKKNVFLLVLIGIALITGIGSADVVPPDMTPSGKEYVTIDHCIIIENENEYPDYVFGVYPWRGGSYASRGFMPFEKQRCFKGKYKFARSEIAAIPRSEYSGMSDEDLREYSNLSILSSDVEAPVTFSEEKPTTVISRTDVLRVTGMSGKSFSVETVRSFNTYSGEQPQDTPKTTVTTSPSAGYHMVTEDSTDRMGGSYTTIAIASRNPDDCSRACLADSRCLAATYVKPGTFQGPEAWCWMKDTVPASASCRDCITFIKIRDDVRPLIDGSGKILVDSTPANATVYLDGQNEGTTPMRIENVPAGSHTLVITKQGFREVQRTVEVSTGAESEVFVRFGGSADPPGFDAPVALGALIVVTAVFLMRAGRPPVQ